MSNVYGIDIGTSNFKMCCKEKDTILNEKNIIAIANKKDLLAFGDEAYEMYEKAPENIDVSFPVKFGVIADIENMQTLLLNFFNKVNGDKKNTGNNDFYIAVPTDVTEVEKRAFYELVADSKVKAKNIYIVDKPVADAIGAGLEDLGKGLRSQVGTMYGTLEKGPRYLEMAEGYVTGIALDANDEIIGYQFVSLGKFTDFVKKGDEPNVAWEKAKGQYGRVDDAVKIIDPRQE